MRFISLFRSNYVFAIFMAALSLQSAQAVDYLEKLWCFRLIVAERDEENDISRAAASFAIAAEYVYQRKTEEKDNHYVPIPFPKTRRESWTLCDVPLEDERLGFYAVAWTRNSAIGKQLVIAFRGTQFKQIPDWTRGNLTTFRFWPWRTQYQAALEFADRAVLRYPGLPVVFTGHSLGGGLAEYCQRFICNSKAIVFHPSPNQGRLFSLGSGRKKYDKHVLRLFERGEILRPFRWLLVTWHGLARDGNESGVKGRWIDFRKGYPWTQHYMTPFAIDLVRQAASDNDESAESVLNQLADDRESKGQVVERWWKK